MTTIENPTRNGVDTATLFATIDAVKGNNDIAKFQFRATNKWINGTHNQSTIHGFFGAMQEMAHQQPFTLRRRPSGDPRRQGQRPDPGRVPAARARRVPHGRHRERRRRSRREPHRGRVDRRGRHRPARDPRARATSSGSQRVRAAAGELQAARRRSGEAPQGRRAVAPAFGRLRRADEWRARQHRRGRGLSRERSPTDTG